jgi:enoyl-CoA hydratase
VTDVRVASLDARFISGFQRIGVHPGGGHFALLARSVGYQAAAALTVFDQEIDGARAASIGLVWEAVAQEQVLPRAMEIAGRVAGDPDLARAVVGSARSEYGPPSVPPDVGLEIELASQLWSLSRKARRSQKTTPRKS